MITGLDKNTSGWIRIQADGYNIITIQEEMSSLNPPVEGSVLYIYSKWIYEYYMPWMDI